jgi:enoyl-CoA hydratase/3-hydroxyacyl-CoA dehydrogenase
MQLEDVTQIAVLGAGNMGHGIAEVAALAGYSVTMRDVEREYVEAGYASTSKPGTSRSSGRSSGSKSAATSTRMRSRALSTGSTRSSTWRLPSKRRT